MFDVVLSFVHLVISVVAVVFGNILISNVGWLVWSFLDNQLTDTHQYKTV